MKAKKADHNRITKVSDVVWCDSVCGVHDNNDDPYGYGEKCKGEHRPLYLFARPSEGEF